MTRVDRKRRRGASVVEVAVVAPLFVLLIFGLIIGGLGVFRYNQVASLAREAARIASVQGTEYAKATGEPAATQDSIHAAALARAAGLDPNRLSTTVTWDKYNAPQTYNPDKTVTTNIVTVTVSYKWKPEALLGREMTLTSTSRMPMSN
jgi:Flp pilus assembly protein TadG